MPISVDKRQAPNFDGKNVIFVGDEPAQAAHSSRVYLQRTN